MDIRSELEHSNVYTVDRNELTDEFIMEKSKNHKVLLICDLGKAENDDKRMSYIEALASADVISDDQIEDVINDKSLAIVVPFHSLEMAERVYRSIAHASHFVSIRLEGEIYSSAC